MPDYKQSTIAGTSWQRASRIQIDNPLNGTPSIMFVEEQAINAGAETILRPVANLTATFDPGNSLHLEIYSKLNELYVILRMARDTAEGGN